MKCSCEKKQYFIAVFIIASLLLHFSVSCSSPKVMDFERFKDAHKKETPDYKEAKFEEDHHGNLYFIKGSIAFPVLLQGSGFTIKSRLRGEIGVYFDIYSDEKDTLVIHKGNTASSDTNSIIKKIPLKKGHNEIYFQHKITANENLLVKSSKGVDFIASTPISHKIIPPDRRQLIFLISADTLSALHMCLYGYDKDTSPNIDAFAEDAVVFTNAFSNSSWTVSSHMSLFTSLLEHKHKVKVAKSYVKESEEEYEQEKKYIFPLSSSIPFLVENLSERFVTVSANGGANVSADFGFFRGFDLFRSDYRDLNDPEASQKLFAKIKQCLLDYEFPRAFYFCHTYHVHMPYNPEKLYLDQMTEEAQINAFDFYDDLGGMRNIFRVFPPDFVKNVKSLYDAEILSFDRSFGDFVSFLKSKDLYDNAMIILLSDHGEEFFEHGSWAHSTDLYNEQIRVPLMIKFPRQDFKGRKIDSNVSLADVMPTLLDYWSIDIPRNLDGKSMMELIEGKEKRERMVVSSLFRSKPFSFLPGKIAMIHREYKLIFNESHRQQTSDFFIDDPPFISNFELYDLNKDPGEKENLFQERSMTEEIRRMHEYLVELAEQMKANMIEESEGKKTKMPTELIEQLKALGYFK